MDIQKSDIEGLQYQPGRFENLMNHKFASQIWSFLTQKISIELLIDATDSNKPAILYLLSEIESTFGMVLGSKEYREVPVLVNNMIKQIMEHFGYQHSGCAICSDAEYIKSTGMYKKSNKEL